MKSEKSKRFLFLFSVLSILLFLNPCFADTTGEILDESDWNVLSKYLKPHEIFNLKWPSENDIMKHTPESISKSTKNECLLLIKEALNPEFVPDNLEKKLIPMKRWGRPTEYYMEKGGSDVFICNFEKNSAKFQILESIDNLYIITKGSANENESHFEYVRKLSQNILSQKFNRDDIREYKKKDFADFTNGLWLFKSFIPLDTIRYRITGIEYFTNGRFVIFILRKVDYSPVNPDPYYKRFKAPPTRAERLQKLPTEIREAFEKNNSETLKTLAKSKDNKISQKTIYELARTYEGQKIIIDLIKHSGEMNNISHFEQAFYFQNKNEEIGIDPEVHKKLIELLDHDSERTRYITATCLGKINDPKDIDVLINKYYLEKDEFARRGIIIALINMEDERTLPVLEDVSKNDPLEQLRQSASKAIEKLKKCEK